MTAKEWDTNDSLTAAFHSLDPAIYDRKMRLFVVACFRASWLLFPDEAARNAIVCSETFADDPSALTGLRAAVEKLELWNQGISPHDPIWLASVAYSASWHDSARHYLAAIQSLLDVRVRSKGVSPSQPLESETRWIDQLELLTLLRDIIGNPFRPIAFSPSWRTEHTVGLAARMYEDRDFAAMPILADALEEAGCEDADMLSHCREPGVHVRGCWVVDLVLGKA